MKREQLEQLRNILKREKELFEDLYKEHDNLKSIGKEEDKDYELYRYKKEVKRLKLSISELENQYNRKNKVINDVLEREELKSSFKILK